MPGRPSNLKENIVTYLIEEGIKRGFTPEELHILLTIANIESSFNPLVRGDGGKSYGLFQINVARMPRFGIDPRRPEQVARLLDWRYNANLALQDFARLREIVKKKQPHWYRDIKAHYPDLAWAYFSYWNHPARLDDVLKGGAAWVRQQQGAGIYRLVSPQVMAQKAKEAAALLRRYFPEVISRLQQDWEEGKKVRRQAVLEQTIEEALKGKQERGKRPEEDTFPSSLMNFIDTFPISYLAWLHASALQKGQKKRAAPGEKEILEMPQFPLVTSRDINKFLQSMLTHYPSVKEAIDTLPPREREAFMRQLANVAQQLTRQVIQRGKAPLLPQREMSSEAQRELIDFIKLGRAALFPAVKQLATRYLETQKLPWWKFAAVTAGSMAVDTIKDIAGFVTMMGLPVGLYAKSREEREKVKSAWEGYFRRKLQHLAQCKAEREAALELYKRLLSPDAMEALKSLGRVLYSGAAKLVHGVAAFVPAILEEIFPRLGEARIPQKIDLLFAKAGLLGTLEGLARKLSEDKEFREKHKDQAAYTMLFMFPSEVSARGTLTNYGWYIYAMQLLREYGHQMLLDMAEQLHMPAPLKFALERRLELAPLAGFILGPTAVSRALQAATKVMSTATGMAARMGVGLRFLNTQTPKALATRVNIAGEWINKATSIAMAPHVPAIQAIERFAAKKLAETFIRSGRITGLLARRIEQGKLPQALQNAAHLPQVQADILRLANTIAFGMGHLMKGSASGIIYFAPHTADGRDWLAGAAAGLAVHATMGLPHVADFLLGEEFKGMSFVERIKEKIKDWGMPPELTENTLKIFFDMVGRQKDVDTMSVVQGLGRLFRSEVLSSLVRSISLLPDGGVENLTPIERRRLASAIAGTLQDTFGQEASRLADIIIQAMERLDTPEARNEFMKSIASAAVVLQRAKTYTDALKEALRGEEREIAEEFFSNANGALLSAIRAFEHYLNIVKPSERRTNIEKLLGDSFVVELARALYDALQGITGTLERKQEEIAMQTAAAPRSRTGVVAPDVVMPVYVSRVRGNMIAALMDLVRRIFERRTTDISPASFVNLLRNIRSKVLEGQLMPPKEAPAEEALRTKEKEKFVEEMTGIVEGVLSGEEDAERIRSSPDIGKDPLREDTIEALARPFTRALIRLVVRGIKGEERQAAVRLMVGELYNNFHDLLTTEEMREAVIRGLRSIALEREAEEILEKVPPGMVMEEGMELGRIPTPKEPSARERVDVEREMVIRYLQSVAKEFFEISKEMEEKEKELNDLVEESKRTISSIEEKRKRGEKREKLAITQQEKRLKRLDAEINRVREEIKGLMDRLYEIEPDVRSLENLIRIATGMKPTEKVRVTPEAVRDAINKVRQRKGMIALLLAEEPLDISQYVAEGWSPEYAQLVQSVATAIINVPGIVKSKTVSVEDAVNLAQKVVEMFLIMQGVREHYDLNSFERSARALETSPFNAVAFVTEKEEEAADAVTRIKNMGLYPIVVKADPQWQPEEERTSVYTVIATDQASWREAIEEANKRFSPNTPLDTAIQLLMTGGVRKPVEPLSGEERSVGFDDPRVSLDELREARAALYKNSEATVAGASAALQSVLELGHAADISPAEKARIGTLINYGLVARLLLQGGPTVPIDPYRTMQAVFVDMSPAFKAKQGNKEGGVLFLLEFDEKEADEPKVGIKIIRNIGEAVKGADTLVWDDLVHALKNAKETNQLYAGGMSHVLVTITASPGTVRNWLIGYIKDTIRGYADMPFEEYVLDQVGLREKINAAAQAKGLSIIEEKGIEEKETPLARYKGQGLPLMTAPLREFLSPEDIEEVSKAAGRYGPIVQAILGMPLVITPWLPKKATGATAHVIGRFLPYHSAIRGVAATPQTIIHEALHNLLNALIMQKTEWRSPWKEQEPVVDRLLTTAGEILRSMVKHEIDGMKRLLEGSIPSEEWQGAWREIWEKTERLIRGKTLGELTGKEAEIRPEILLAAASVAKVLRRALVDKLTEDDLANLAVSIGILASYRDIGLNSTVANRLREAGKLFHPELLYTLPWVRFLFVDSNLQEHPGFRGLLDALLGESKRYKHRRKLELPEKQLIGAMEVIEARTTELFAVPPSDKPEMLRRIAGVTYMLLNENMISSIKESLKSIGDAARQLLEAEQQVLGQLSEEERQALEGVIRIATSLSEAINSDKSLVEKARLVGELLSQPEWGTFLTTVEGNVALLRNSSIWNIVANTHNILGQYNEATRSVASALEVSSWVPTTPSHSFVMLPLTNIFEIFPRAISESLELIGGIQTARPFIAIAAALQGALLQVFGEALSREQLEKITELVRMGNVKEAIRSYGDMIKYLGLTPDGVRTLDALYKASISLVEAMHYFPEAFLRSVSEFTGVPALSLFPSEDLALVNIMTHLTETFFRRGEVPQSDVRILTELNTRWAKLADFADHLFDEIRKGTVAALGAFRIPWTTIPGAYLLTRLLAGRRFMAFIPPAGYPPTTGRLQGGVLGEALYKLFLRMFHNPTVEDFGLITHLRAAPTEYDFLRTFIKATFPFAFHGGWQLWTDMMSSPEKAGNFGNAFKNYLKLLSITTEYALTSTFYPLAFSLVSPPSIPRGLPERGMSQSMFLRLAEMGVDVAVKIMGGMIDSILEDAGYTRESSEFAIMKGLLEKALRSDVEGILISGNLPIDIPSLTEAVALRGMITERGAYETAFVAWKTPQQLIRNAHPLIHNLLQSRGLPPDVIETLLRYLPTAFEREEIQSAASRVASNPFNMPAVGKELQSMASELGLALRQAAREDPTLANALSALLLTDATRTRFRRETEYELGIREEAYNTVNNLMLDVVSAMHASAIGAALHTVGKSGIEQARGDLPQGVREALEAQRLFRLAEHAAIGPGGLKALRDLVGKQLREMEIAEEKVEEALNTYCLFAYTDIDTVRGLVTAASKSFISPGDPAFRDAFTLILRQHLQTSVRSEADVPELRAAIATAIAKAATATHMLASDIEEAIKSEYIQGLRNEVSQIEALLYYLPKFSEEALEHLEKYPTTGPIVGKLIKYAEDLGILSADEISPIREKLKELQGINTEGATKIINEARRRLITALGNEVARTATSKGIPPEAVRGLAAAALRRNGGQINTWLLVGLGALGIAATVAPVIAPTILPLLHAYWGIVASWGLFPIAASVIGGLITASLVKRGRLRGIMTQVLQNVHTAANNLTNAHQQAITNLRNILLNISSRLANEGHAYGAFLSHIVDEMLREFPVTPGTATVTEALKNALSGLGQLALRGTSGEFSSAAMKQIRKEVANQLGQEVPIFAALLSSANALGAYEHALHMGRGYFLAYLGEAMLNPAAHPHVPASALQKAMQSLALGTVTMKLYAAAKAAVEKGIDLPDVGDMKLEDLANIYEPFRVIREYKYPPVATPQAQPQKKRITIDDIQLDVGGAPMQLSQMTVRQFWDTFVARYFTGPMNWDSLQNLLALKEACKLAHNMIGAVWRAEVDGAIEEAIASTNLPMRMAWRMLQGTIPVVRNIRNALANPEILRALLEHPELQTLFIMKLLEAKEIFDALQAHLTSSGTQLPPGLGDAVTIMGNFLTELLSELQRNNDTRGMYEFALGMHNKIRGKILEAIGELTPQGGLAQHLAQIARQFIDKLRTAWVMTTFTTERRIAPPGTEPIGYQLARLFELLRANAKRALSRMQQEPFNVNLLNAIAQSSWQLTTTPPRQFSVSDLPSIAYARLTTIARTARELSPYLLLKLLTNTLGTQVTKIAGEVQGVGETALWEAVNKFMYNLYASPDRNIDIQGLGEAIFGSDLWGHLTTTQEGQRLLTNATMCAMLGQYLIAKHGAQTSMAYLLSLSPHLLHLIERYYFPQKRQQELSEVSPELAAALIPGYMTPRGIPRPFFLYERTGKGEVPMGNFLNVIDGALGALAAREGSAPYEGAIKAMIALAPTYMQGALRAELAVSLGYAGDISGAARVVDMLKNEADALTLWAHYVGGKFSMLQLLQQPPQNAFTRFLSVMQRQVLGFNVLSILRQGFAWHAAMAHLADALQDVTPIGDPLFRWGALLKGIAIRIGLVQPTEVERILLESIPALMERHRQSDNIVLAEVEGAIREIASRYPDVIRTLLNPTASAQDLQDAIGKITAAAMLTPAKRHLVTASTALLSTLDEALVISSVLAAFRAYILNSITQGREINETVLKEAMSFAQQFAAATQATPSVQWRPLLFQTPLWIQLFGPAFTQFVVYTFAEAAIMTRLAKNMFSAAPHLWKQLAAAIDGVRRPQVDWGSIAKSMAIAFSAMMAWSLGAHLVNSAFVTATGRTLQEPPLGYPPRKDDPLWTYLFDILVSCVPGGVQRIWNLLIGAFTSGSPVASQEVLHSWNIPPGLRAIVMLFQNAVDIGRLASSVFADKDVERNTRMFPHRYLVGTGGVERKELPRYLLDLITYSLPVVTTFLPAHLRNLLSNVTLSQLSRTVKAALAGRLRIEVEEERKPAFATPVEAPLPGEVAGLPAFLARTLQLPIGPPFWQAGRPPMSMLAAVSNVGIVTDAILRAQNLNIEETRDLVIRATADLSPLATYITLFEYTQNASKVKDLGVLADLTDLRLWADNPEHRLGRIAKEIGDRGLEAIQSPEDIEGLVTLAAITGSRNVASHMGYGNVRGLIDDINARFEDMSPQWRRYLTSMLERCEERNLRSIIIAKRDAERRRLKEKQALRRAIRRRKGRVREEEAGEQNIEQLINELEEIIRRTKSQIQE